MSITDEHAGQIAASSALLAKHLAQTLRIYPSHKRAAPINCGSVGIALSGHVPLSHPDLARKVWGISRLALRLSKLERKACPEKPLVIEIMHYADELPADEEIRKYQAQLPPNIKIELKLCK